MTLLLAIGCAGPAEEAKDEAAPATEAVAEPAQEEPAAESTFDRVMRTKIVRVGTQTSSAPAGFIDENGELVGFDVDIAKEICKRVGAEFQHTEVNNTTRITMLQSGQLDMTLANMTHKRERDENIDFSITYFFDGQKYLVPKGEYTKWEDLVGKKISSMQGTTSIKNSIELMSKLGDAEAEKNHIGFQNEAEAYESLKSGRVAAMTTDSSLLVGVAANDPGAYELIGDYFSDEPYGIGLPENNSDWRDAVNAALQDMWRDGTYAAIYNTWYGPDSKWSFPLTGKIE
ncbi:MAG: transporter substrate-binding domain-containing protein, partial [Proteobacteria bacterium]|nr:transporter substrate-binding domain-containing protein [Pseudomonadota bacterium]